MACDEAVYASIILLLVEYYNHWIRDNNLGVERDVEPFIIIQERWRHIYLLFGAVSLTFATLNFYNMNMKWLSHSWVLSLVPYFYVIDSFAAIGLGQAMIHRDLSEMVIYLQILANFFLLYIVNRTYAPTKVRDSIVSHVYFMPHAMILTGVW